MREMQGRMRHLQQTIGPPIGPDGRPMVMGPGGPMGPRPGPPPNHPVMMEMAALDKHLRGLYQQPQNPEIHAQVTRYEMTVENLLLILFADSRMSRQNEKPTAATYSAVRTSPRHDGASRTTGSSSHDGTWRTCRTWRSRAQWTSIRTLWTTTP